MIDKKTKVVIQIPKFDDLTGKKFGMWTVIKRVDNYITPSGNFFTQYECECGCKAHTRKLVLANALKSGRSKSCGCYHDELSREIARASFTIHGESKTRYKIWAGIHKRCLNPNSKNYQNYGGRGISVCHEWDNYLPFKQWALDNGYSDSLTIDRIDVNGDYNPQNCRWVDIVVQANNRRTSRVITYNGESHTAAEWSRILDVPYKTFHKKLKNTSEAEAIQFYQSLKNQLNEY